MVKRDGVILEKNSLRVREDWWVFEKSHHYGKRRTGVVSDSSLQRAVAACELLQHASGFIKVLKDEIYLLAAVEMRVFPYVAPLQCDVEFGDVLDPT